MESTSRAGFGVRLVALAVDIIIVSAIAGVVASGLHLGTSGLFLMISIVYFIVFWVISGTTPGKRLLRLRVVSGDGEKPTLTAATLRFLGYCADTVLLGLGFLWIAIDREKQGLHDKIAGTYVVRAQKVVPTLSPPLSPVASSTEGEGPLISPAIAEFSSLPVPAVPTDWGSDADQRAAEQLIQLLEAARTAVRTRPTTEAEGEERLRQLDTWTEQLKDVSTRLATLISPFGQASADSSVIQRATVNWRRWRWMRTRSGWVNQHRSHTAALLTAARGAAQAALRDARLRVAQPEASSQVLQRVLMTRPDLEVVVHDRTAYLQFTAPANTIPTTISETKQTSQGTSVKTRARPQQEINRDYKDVVAKTARDVIGDSFRAVPGLEKVAVSIFQSAIHPTLGHRYSRCILSVLADRATWQQIFHPNVTAENALRNFDLRYRYNPSFELQEVAPFQSPSMATADGQPLLLHDIDPLDFERLVKDLLTKMGFQARLTKASHDGGIDVEAYNPAPIVGGNVIVQCKRYSGTIGAPIVRDLYGTVMSTRATKGILITTSDFSPDARSFAADKPLELVNGQQLAVLLRQYGFPVSGAA